MCSLPTDVLLLKPRDVKRKQIITQLPIELTAVLTSNVIVGRGESLGEHSCEDLARSNVSKNLRAF